MSEILKWYAHVWASLGSARTMGQAWDKTLGHDQPWPPEENMGWPWVAKPKRWPRVRDAGFGYNGSARARLGLDLDSDSTQPRLGLESDWTRTPLGLDSDSTRTGLDSDSMNSMRIRLQLDSGPQ